MILLAPVFAVFGKLIEQSLDLAGGGAPGLIGMLVALFMTNITAPRTAKQLGLIVAIVTAGGLLTTMIAVAAELVGWGSWTTVMVGSAVGTLVGCSLVLLSYKGLGVPMKRPVDYGES